MEQFQGLKYIWQTEGFWGLFKGNGTNCARMVPNSAVKFYSYEQASKRCWAHPFTMPWGCSLCWNHCHVCNLSNGHSTRQVDRLEKFPYQYRGMFHALSTVLQEEGPRDLYKGWLSSVIGVVLYVGLKFAVYETLKDWLIKTKPFGLIQDLDLSVTTRLACRVVARTVGQTVAYPLDVIRGRMQMVGWKDASSVVTTGDGRTKAPLEYNGFGALYKGSVPNSVKVVPSIAIAFVTYEVVKWAYGKHMPMLGVAQASGRLLLLAACVCCLRWFDL